MAAGRGSDGSIVALNDGVTYSVSPSTLLVSEGDTVLYRDTWTDFHQPRFSGGATPSSTAAPASTTAPSTTAAPATAAPATAAPATAAPATAAPATADGEHHDRDDDSDHFQAGRLTSRRPMVRANPVLAQGDTITP